MHRSQFDAARSQLADQLQRRHWQQESYETTEPEQEESTDTHQRSQQRHHETHLTSSDADTEYERTRIDQHQQQPRASDQESDEDTLQEGGYEEHEEDHTVPLRIVYPREDASDQQFDDAPTHQTSSTSAAEDAGGGADSIIRQHMFAHFTRSHSLPIVPPAIVATPASADVTIIRAHSVQQQTRSGHRAQHSATSSQQQRIQEEKEDAEDDEAQYRQQQQQDVQAAQESLRRRQQMAVRYPEDDEDLTETLDEEYERKFASSQPKPHALSGVVDPARHPSHFQYPAPAPRVDATVVSPSAAAASQKSAAQWKLRGPNEPLPGQGRLNEIARRLAQMEDLTDPRSSAAKSARKSPADSRLMNRSEITSSDFMSNFMRSDDPEKNPRENLVEALRKINRLRSERAAIAAPHLSSTYTRRQMQAQAIANNSFFGHRSIKHATSAANPLSPKVHALHAQYGYPDVRMPSVADPPYARPSPTGPLVDDSDMPSFMRSANGMTLSGASASRRKAGDPHDLSLSSILSASNVAHPPRLRQLLQQAKNDSVAPEVMAVLQASESHRKQLAELKEAEMHLQQSQHTLELEMHEMQRKAVTPVVSSRTVAGAHSTPYAIPSRSPPSQSSIRISEDPSGGSEFYLYGRDAQAEEDERKLAERIEKAHAARQQLIQQQDELLVQQQQLLRHNAAVLAQTLGNSAAQPVPAPSPAPSASHPRLDLSQQFSAASSSANYVLPPDLASPSVKARRATVQNPSGSPAAYAPPVDPATSPSVKAIRDSLRETQREWDEVDVAITGKPMSHPPSPPGGRAQQVITVDPETGVATTSEVITTGGGRGQPQIHVHVHNHLGSAASSKTNHSPVHAAAAAAAQRHFATRASPLSAAVVSPVRSTLPNSPTTTFDNMASAHELERQQRIYMSKTGRVVPSGTGEGGVGGEKAIIERIRRKEIALKQSEREAKGQDAATADGPDLSTYMRTFNALESKLTHSLGLPSPDFDAFAEGDLERAITLHRTRLAFDATANPDRPDGMEDRYLDHMIHQKQVLLERLTTLEVDEARARQEERLKFELQLAEIETDARERDRWNQANGIVLRQVPAQPSGAGLSSRSPTRAQLQSIGETLSSTMKRPPGFSEWSASARGSIAPTSIAPTQRFNGGYDPSTDAHLSAAERESRSRLALARDHIARMEQLEDEQRSAAQTARENEEREFEEELRTEREARHSKWLREREAIEAQTRRTIEEQIAYEARTRIAASVRTEISSKLASQLHENQLAAALLADEISSDAVHFREKREEWIGKLKKERDEWTVRKQQDADREVRRANERAQTAAFHATTSEIQLTREIEARVQREVQALSPKKSSSGPASSQHHLGTITGNPPSSLPSLPASAVNSHRDSVVDSHRDSPRSSNMPDLPSNPLSGPNTHREPAAAAAAASKVPHLASNPRAGRDQHRETTTVAAGHITTNMPLPSAPVSAVNTSRTELPAVVDSRAFTPREDLFEQKTEKEYHRQDDAAANFTTALSGKKTGAVSNSKSIQQEATDEELEQRHIEAALAEEEYAILTGTSKFLSPPSSKGLAASRSSVGEESVDEFGFPKKSRKSDASVPASPASGSQEAATGASAASNSTEAASPASKVASTAGKPIAATNPVSDESFPRMGGQKRPGEAGPASSLEGSSGNFDWLNSDSDLDSPAPKAPTTDWKAARAAKWKQAAAVAGTATPNKSSTAEVHNTTPAPVLRAAARRSSLNRNDYNDFGDVSQSRLHEDASGEPSRETSVSRKDVPAEEHELDAPILSSTDVSHPSNFGASLRPGSSNTAQHRIQADANETLQLSPQGSPSKEGSVASSFLDRRRRMQFVSDTSKAPGQAVAQAAASPSRQRRPAAAPTETSPIRDHYADQVREHDDPAVRDHDESQEFDFGASQDGTWLP